MTKEFREMLKEIWNMDFNEYKKSWSKYKKLEKISMMNDMLKKKGV